MRSSPEGIGNMARNTEKRAKSETHTAGPGMWWETVKYVKYVKYTLCDLDLGEKTAKQGKRDTINVWPGIWRETLKNM